LTAVQFIIYPETIPLKSPNNLSITVENNIKQELLIICNQPLRTDQPQTNPTGQRGKHPFRTLDKRFQFQKQHKDKGRKLGQETQNKTKQSKTKQSKIKQSKAK
jgi:hypothetical protein